jgi:WD40 repeat protein
MKLIKVLAICLLISSLVAVAQTNTRAIDLSKLELLNRIVVPGHVPDALAESPLDTARFSPNGKGLAILDNNGRLIWWEVNTGKQLESWRLWKPLAGINFKYQIDNFVDRHTVRLHENGKRYKLFDLETGKMRDDNSPNKSSPVETKCKQDKICTSDGQFYLEFENYAYPVLREVKTNALIRRFGHSVTAFDVAPNGEYVVTGSVAGSMRIWNIKTGKEISRFTGDSKRISNLVISPNGNVIATVIIETPEVRLWNLKGTELRRIKLPTLNQLGWDDYNRVDLSFSRDNQILAATLSGYLSNGLSNALRQFALRLYRTQDGINIPLPPVNQNSRLIFTNNSDVLMQEEKLEQETEIRSRLSLIRIANGNAVWVGTWRAEYDQSLVFSLDGSIFARSLETFGSEGNLSTGISSITTRTGDGQGWFKVPAYSKSLHRGPRPSAIAPDNRTLLIQTTEDDSCGSIFWGIRMYDLQTKRNLPLPKKLADDYRRDLGCYGDVGDSPIFKFSPDGKYLMVWVDNRIDVWGTRDNRAIFKGQ